MGLWHPNPTATTAVFGPAATVNAWTNLDISAVVGTQEVWAVMAFEQTAGAVIFRPAVRPDLSALQYYSGANTAHGASRSGHPAGVKTLMIASLTSATGVVEWTTNSVANTCKIYVLGWLDVTTDTTLLVTGAWPAAWTTEDVSAIVGTQRSLIIPLWHRTGGVQNTMSLRPGDVADNCLMVAAANRSAGVNQDGNDAINIYSNPITMTDDLGTFDYNSEAAVPNGDLSMAAWAPAMTPTNTPLFAAAAPPLAWTDLDCTTGPSGATGLVGQCLVYLKIHRENIAGNTILDFRTNGDTKDYQHTGLTHARGCNGSHMSTDDHTFVVLPTDANGVIEWIADVNAADIDIELMGWIPEIAHPVFSNGSPAGATVNDVTNTFGFDIYADTAGPGIDLSTLKVDVDIGGADIDAIAAGVLQTAKGWEASSAQIPGDGANVGSVLLTYLATGVNWYRWPWLTTSAAVFPPGTYDCTADVDDKNGASAVQYTWQFTVTSPGPTTTGILPTGVLVANNAPVQFTIAAPLLGNGDIYEGEQRPIVQNTIDLDLTDPALAVHNAIIGGVFQTGYAGTFVPDGLDGYTVNLTTHPTWANGVWSADAKGTDTGGDSDTDTFGWTVVGDPPSISNEHPEDVTTEFIEIGCRCNDAAGFNVATLAMTATPAGGQPVSIIVAGAFQTGWDGVIYESDDPGTGPRQVDIHITTWPTLADGVRYTFEVTMTNIVGLVL